ncbi:MAG: DUF1761 domain-containing protein [Flavobacteriales bacterium]
MNIYAILVSTLVPMIIGAIYYNPKLFGNAWMKSAGLTIDQLKGSNMAKILTMTLVYSLLASSLLSFMVIHQLHIGSVLANEPGINDPNSEVAKYMKNFMDTYGDRFRTFKHGAFHGGLTTIFFVLPMIAIPAMFERRSAKYILIHAGYWFISLCIMGGIICAWK